MTTGEARGGPSWLLRARETEQLGRIADRIRLERRVLAYIACEPESRGEVVAWLSKAAGREVPAPVECSAQALLAHLESAAVEAPRLVVSLSWSPGDRDAIAALNLHREKLRRGASMLIWCAPRDLDALQTEGQDAYSFRDTLVVISGFSIPAVHVPSDDTPEIRLARARLSLPGTPFEKALAAADLGTLLLERGYYIEAVRVCDATIEPFLEDGEHLAARGTMAHLAGTLSAALAAVGAVSAARRWAEVALDSGLRTGAIREEDELESIAAAVEPASPAPLAAARALHGFAADFPWDSFGRQHGLLVAELRAETGQHRVSRAGDEPADPEAVGILALARGDLGEAAILLQRAAAAAVGRDEDNRSQLLALLDCLHAEGDVRCAAALLTRLRQARPTDWLPLQDRLRRARVLSSIRRIEDARRLLRYEERPSPFLDGDVYARCKALVSVVCLARAARQIDSGELAATAEYLAGVQAWFPPPDEGTPPFYRVLFPGLLADVLSRIPERAAEAIELARSAWDLARAEIPRYAPEHAARTVRLLVLQNRFDEALEAATLAEPEAEAMEDLRALSALRVQRALAHVGRGDEALQVGSAMAALRETLDASGSPRLTAESLLSLARGLPPSCEMPDAVALAEEASERFADMPMLALEELCRETKGDALLARGRREEAAECFAAAMKRLRHYGLLLRVPLLRAKHQAALGQASALVSRDIRGRSA